MAQMEKENLIDHPYLVCQGKQKWKPSSKLYQRAIRYAYHNLLLVIRKTSKNHFPPKKEKRKKWPIMLIWGFFKNPSKFTFSLWAQTEDLVLESQINYHFENFPNQTVQIFITPQQRIKKYIRSTKHIFCKMEKLILRT